MLGADSELTHSIVYADLLKAKNQGDKDFFWSWTVPSAILLTLFVIACLFFTRHDSLCCQVIFYIIFFTIAAGVQPRL